MTLRVLSSYAQALEELRRLAKEQEALGDLDAWAALENEAEALSNWLSNGQRGSCPVDLEKHGWRVQLASEPSAEAQPETSEVTIAPVTEAPASVLPAPREATTLPAEAQPPIAMEPGQGMPGEAGMAERLESEPPPPLEVETPEQAELRRQLAEARRYFEKGEWRQAVALSRLITERAGAEAALKEAAADLLDRAQRELNAQLERLLALGHAARAGNQTDEARRHYRAARELDPDNADARRALLELDHFLAEQLSREELVRLRGSLKERRDLRRLGEAVYWAEALEAEGRLTDELAVLLRQARKAYDDIRKAMGEETTMMRLADLAGRKAARDKVAERVAAGEREIFDITVNQYRPAFEVLSEANALYERASEETAEYEANRVNRALPVHPVWARQRLQEALQKPFFEHHRRKLEDKLREVEALIANKEKAEALLAEAADDPVKTLRRALEAQAIFPHLEGLAERVAQARKTAMETLAVRMEKHHEQAEACLMAEAYAKARDELENAGKVAAQWPEAEAPALLRKLLDAGQALRERIKAREDLRREFDKLAATIRERTLNPDLRQAGLELFRELRADPRFADFPDLKVLKSEMDQYTGLGEQLEEAQEARARHDWERVRELCQKIKESGKAGQFAREVNALYEEALVELDIARAQRHLEDDEIVEANSILSTLIRTAKNAERKAALEKRLKTELEKINQCIEHNPPMQTLFDEAKQLANKKGATERLQALRRFRYVGGDTTEERQPGWPEYRLSLRTAQARKEARALSVKLRQELLAPLQQAYALRQTSPPDESGLRLMAERARLLREARLLESEEERAVVRWLEVEQGRRDAQAREAEGDWDGAINIWQALDAHHPLTVEADLRRARIQQVITQARSLVRQDQAQQALDRLREAQQAPGLAHAWPIHLALAETHARLGNFPQAFAAVAEAERWEEGKEAAQAARADIRREQAIRQALARADKELPGNPREALRLLQEALSQPLTRDSHRLRERRDDIFTETEARLLRMAREVQTRGGPEGKVQAVIALVDLRELETILNRPDAERRSSELLNPLRTELARVAESVIREAQSFDPALMPLEQAIRAAEELAGRLQTFTSVARLFEQELGGAQERLIRRRDDIAGVSEKLKRLKTLLDEAGQVGLWENALRADNFEALEQKLREIQQTGLTAMLEVQNFEQRLSEWKEMHAYLMRKIAEIREKFQGREEIRDGRKTERPEDFSGVVDDLRRLRVRPEVRANAQLWRQIQQADYEAIRQVMSDRLRIVDIFGEGSIAGWETVEQAALERGQELEAWKAWEAECARRMDAGDQARAAAQAHTSATPLVKKRNDWLAVQTAAQTAIDMLARGPERDGVRVPIRSNAARQHHIEGKRRLEIAQDWLAIAGRQLAALEPELQGPGKGFPTPAEFNAAVATKDCDRLGRLLERARVVGASSPEEEKRMKNFSRVYNEMCGEGKGPEKKANPFAGLFKRS